MTTEHKPQRNPLAIALALREAIRAHRKNKPISFPKRRRP